MPPEPVGVANASPFKIFFSYLNCPCLETFRGFFYDKIPYLTVTSPAFFRNCHFCVPFFCPWTGSFPAFLCLLVHFKRNNGLLGLETRFFLSFPSLYGHHTFDVAYQSAIWNINKFWHCLPGQWWPVCYLPVFMHNGPTVRMARVISATYSTP